MPTRQNLTSWVKLTLRNRLLMKKQQKNRRKTQKWRTTNKNIHSVPSEDGGWSPVSERPAMPCLDCFDPTVRWSLSKHHQSLFTVSFLFAMKANDLYFLSYEAEVEEKRRCLGKDLSRPCRGWLLHELRLGSVQLFSICCQLAACWKLLAEA